MVKCTVFSGRSIFAKAWQSADAALAAEIHRRPVGGGADVAMAEDCDAFSAWEDGDFRIFHVFFLIKGFIMEFIADLMIFMEWNWMGG